MVQRRATGIREAFTVDPTKSISYGHGLNY
jgi:hypothetical protein